MKNSFIKLTLVILITPVYIHSRLFRQTEEQVLASLREMTKDGKLPPESVVADIESRFANKKSGGVGKAAPCTHQA